MTFRRLFAWLGLATAALAPPARAEERNFWPIVVQQVNPAGEVESWGAMGPLFFSHPAAEGGRVSGFRPIYIRRNDAKGGLAEFTVLYPIYFYRSYGDTYESSVFDLINRYGRKDGAPASSRTEAQTFDIWPIYFSRETGDPATSYHGVFPIAGSIQDFLIVKQASWVLFPLYLRAERHDAVTTSTPWPILRVTRGAEHGFALWPLFGWDDRPGVFHTEFYLWPLGWNNTRQPNPDKPLDTGPTRQVGALPFYASVEGPGLVDKTYLWPFFGYTDRTNPDYYHETRYFWPFLVQGLGPKKYVDRWGPFYTHSIYKGIDKTWYLWPLWRQVKLTEDGLDQTKRQLFYFLYFDLVQRSPTNPDAAPAEKLHVWPLFSWWDNGAGHRQLQFPSPLEVFFPRSTEMRETWTPFFSLYRSDREANGDRRSSVLWDAVTWESHPREGRSSFHLGPLLGVETRPGERRWRVFGMEFSANHPKPQALAR
jgi:hypothetical protein